ncbi:MAG TPA: AAA family ATPase [Burkholderiaceae bacterium]
MRSLLSITAKNFLSLQDVEVELQELSVLVGPNGAGKSNLLKVIQFLGDTARYDLGPAIQEHGGYERLVFRSPSKEHRAPRITLGIKGRFTKNSSDIAPDEYTLSFSQRQGNAAAHNLVFSQRREEFIFKRKAGPGRRITIAGGKAEIQRATQQRQLALATTSSGLSTLPKLGRDEGGEQITMLADLLKNFRVFEVDAKKARRPAEFDRENSKLLDSDAGNLASFLRWLHDYESDVFELFVDDLRTIAPTVEDVRVVKIGGGSDEAVAVQLKERGLAGLTNMSEASFGTIRAMALLAMLHDPNPPRLTCVEEIDHGLHPHALDRIVERLRSASRRTQLLVVTHSPALANRLNPGELIVCERDLETGASRIPAISSINVARMAAVSNLSLGELWFSGALGGGLE